MSVLVNKNSRVLVQGITGKAGSFHTEQCLAYGTKIVAGVKPGGKGLRHLDVPIYNSVRDAREDTGADVSLIFVPAPVCADAVFEAAEAGMPLIVCITEGMPVLDMARVRAAVRGSGLTGSGITMIGPNCPGIITPGEAKIGIMPGSIHKAGRVGVISRSGTLTYEAVWQLSERGIGQSTCIGIGGDPIGGLTFKEALALFEADPGTDGVVMIGEIGGTAEEEAAAFIKEKMKKPVVAFIAGTTAPKGKRMGHAGAIIAGGKGTAAEKIAALEEAGATVIASPADIGEAMEKRLQ